MPRLDHFRQITRVWQAPGNRVSRIKALLRALAWTVQKRVIKRPLEIMVFTDRRFYCYPDGFIGNSIRLFSEWQTPTRFTSLMSFCTLATIFWMLERTWVSSLCSHLAV
jgi:hypothetical protein